MLGEGEPAAAEADVKGLQTTSMLLSALATTNTVAREPEALRRVGGPRKLADDPIDLRSNGSPGCRRALAGPPGPPPRPRPSPVNYIDKIRGKIEQSLTRCGCRIVDHLRK